MGFWDLRFFTCRASRLLADHLSSARAPGPVGVEVLNPPWHLRTLEMIGVPHNLDFVLW